MATIRKDFIPGPQTVVGEKNTNDPYICNMREVLVEDAKDPTWVVIWQKPENSKHQINYIVDVEEPGKEALKTEWVDAAGEHHDKGDRVDGFNYTRVDKAETLDKALDLAEGKLDRSLREGAADTAIAEVEEAIADAVEETTGNEVALVTPNTAEQVRSGGKENKKNKKGKKNRK